MLAYGYSGIRLEEKLYSLPVYTCIVDLHITMIDFSEVACKFQEKVITSMISNALKQNPDATKSFLEEKNNSIVIKREDARSLSLPDNSVDILLDKVRKANFQTSQSGWEASVGKFGEKFSRLYSRSDWLMR